MHEQKFWNEPNLSPAKVKRQHYVPRLLLRAIVAALLLVIPFMYAAGCSVSEPNIEKVVLSAGIGEYGQPVGIESTFPMTQDVVYASVTVGNVHRTTKVGARFILNKDFPTEEIELANLKAMISRPSVIPFSVNRPGDLFPAGEYQLIVYIDDKEVTSLPFSVKVPMPTVQKLAADLIPNTTEFLHTTYTWVMNGTNLTLNMDIPKALYDFYKAKKRIQTLMPEVYSLYVSHPDDDEYILRIADAIKQMALEQGLTPIQYAESILKFVRSVTYATDAQSEGYDEYPRYPIETLVDHEGDCEDSAILLASIMQASGMSPVLLITKPTVMPGHAAVGIAGEGSTDLFYYHYEGKNYTYLEATNSSLRIGELPGIYKLDDFVVVPIKPLPAITLDDVYYFRQGRVYRVKAYVKNIGSTTVDNIAVYGELLSADNVTVSQASETFSLSVNEQALVTFYLAYRFPGELDLRVYGSVNGIPYPPVEERVDGP